MAAGDEAEITDELNGVKIIKLDPGEVQTEDDTQQVTPKIIYDSGLFLYHFCAQEFCQLESVFAY